MSNNSDIEAPIEGGVSIFWVMGFLILTFIVWCLPEPRSESNPASSTPIASRSAKPSSLSKQASHNTKTDLAAKAPSKPRPKQTQVGNAKSTAIHHSSKASIPQTRDSEPVERSCSAKPSSPSKQAVPKSNTHAASKVSLSRRPEQTRVSNAKSTAIHQSPQPTLSQTLKSEPVENSCPLLCDHDHYEDKETWTMHFEDTNLVFTPTPEQVMLLDLEVGA